MGNKALKGGGNLALDGLRDFDSSDLQAYQARPIFEQIRHVSVWKSSDGHARMRVGVALARYVAEPGPLWKETFAGSRVVLEMVVDRETVWCECLVLGGGTSIKWNGDSFSFTLCPRDEKSAALLVRVLIMSPSHMSQVKFLTIHFPGGKLQSKPIRHRFAS